jgi:hypothetical protein
MAAPYKVFARRLEVKLTARQAEALEHRAVLEGTTPSEVIRIALDAYLSESRRRRRVSAK